MLTRRLPVPKYSNHSAYQKLPSTLHLPIHLRKISHAGRGRDCKFPIRWATTIHITRPKSWNPLIECWDGFFIRRKISAEPLDKLVVTGVLGGIDFHTVGRSAA